MTLPQVLGFLSHPVKDPTNREEALVHVESIAIGLKVWVAIDAFIVPFALVLWLFGTIQPAVLGLAILFAVGGPATSLALNSVASSYHLTAREFWSHLREKLFS